MLAVPLGFDNDKYVMLNWYSQRKFHVMVRSHRALALALSLLWGFQ